MLSNKDEDSNEDMNYIYYNSLISIKLVPDTNNPRQKSFYMLRMENLDQSLILKRCDTPILQYSDLKESLFYIRNIEECIKIFGNKGGNSSEMKRQDFKEYIFRNDIKLNFNQNFILQHMTSKKFISIEKLQGTDNYTLKLVIEIEKALTFPFCFKRINSSSEFLSYKNIVYISIFNKEKSQNYYINHNSMNLEKFNNDLRKSKIIDGIKEDKKNMANLGNYSDLRVVNYFLDKFYIINQNWFINDKGSLYNGQLISIIFTGDKNKVNNKMMLGAEGIKVENKEEEIIGIKEEVREDIDGLMKDNNQKFTQFNCFTDRIKDQDNLYSSIKVKAIPYKDDLYEHVVNNSFWVAEKKTIKQDELDVKAIEINELIRIKNPLLGKYLIVKKKYKETNEITDSDILKNSVGGTNNNSDMNKSNNINYNTNKNLNNNNNDIITSDANNKKEEEFEFELVTEEVLERQYFNYNFKFFHYNVNEEKKLSANGKYILQTVIINDNIENNKNNHKKDGLIQDDKSFFESISLNVTNDSDYISIKSEDDYILNISKVDPAKGNEVIFLQNVIYDLDYILKNYKKKKASSSNVIKKITENINFFMEYLLNIDYMFKNDNYEINRPVTERQFLLYKFNILNIFKEVIEYFFPIVKDINTKDISIFERYTDNSGKKTRNFLTKKHSTKSLAKEGNKLLEDDSKISNIKSMLKLLLKFLVYLSMNNDQIKQDIFTILSQILEFSEYIYIDDKSDLLNFIFELLNNSETLQDYVLSMRFKPTKMQYTDNIDGILFIDKILSYIETNWNYLYYYKKLLYLNKIRYREDDIREKIKLHITKVENDFRLNNNTNNYKGKIHSAIKIITDLVNNQIKEWNKYLDDKNNIINKNNEVNKVKEENDEDEESDDNTNINKIFGRAKRSDNNGALQNESKKEGSIKGNLNNRKINLSNGSILGNKEETKNDADSNDPLNRLSMFNPQNKRKKTLFNSAIKIPLINNEEKTKNIDTNNQNHKIIESDDNFNNLTIKKTEIELANLAKIKISNLNKVLDFLVFFRTINLDKILFRRDELYRKMLKSEFKDGSTENNLNFIINGNVCFIKFINDLDFTIETTIGSVMPYYIYNNFYINDIENFKEKEKKYSNDFTEENESNNIGENNNNDNQEEESSELNEENEDEEKENEEEGKENDDINNIFEDNDNEGNIGNYINNEEENKESFSNKDIDEKNNDIDNNNKKQSIFISDNTKELTFNQKRRYTSAVGAFHKKKKLIEDEKDSKNDLEQELEDIEEENNKNERNKKKHRSLLIRKEHYKESVKNILNEEAEMNDFIRFIEKSKEEYKKINKYLYKLYIIYMFCGNECMTINYIFFKILINYYINYDRFSKSDTLKGSLVQIKSSILKKIVFLNENSFLNKIYNKIKENQTLLEDNFDLQNFIDNENFMSQIDKENNNKYLISFNRIETNDLNKNNKNIQNYDYWFKRLKKLSNEEIKLVDFLIYFCKVNDQINYLINKIDCFKNIRKLILSAQNELSINNEKKIKEKEIYSGVFDEEKEKIMTNLISNKFNILSLYEKLNEIKNKYLDSHHFSMENNLLEDYGIFKQADFMLWLLDQYEIDKYLNKIIYLEINMDLSQDKNSYEKLMNIKDLFQTIESEIHKAKEESEKKNIDENNTKENHYKIISNKLMTMTKKVLLNIFSKKEIKEENLVQMLKNENENFFVKIGFLNTLKIMIESIQLYDLQYDIQQNEDNYLLKLNYCKEILRAFLEIQNSFPKFNKMVSDNLDIFKKLIIYSLKSIKDFNGKDQKKKMEEENAFLCISYYSSEILFFLLNLAPNTYSEILGYVINIFEILKNIYNCFQPKNKVTFQLFYNYLVIRISLLIHKSKDKVTYTVESFFKSIYDIKMMKERILDCISKLQSTQENSSGTSNFIEENENSENIENSENSESDMEKSKKGDKDKFQQWKKKLNELEMKKINNEENSKIDKNNQTNINNINTHEGFGLTNDIKNKTMWETEEEKEKLMFFLYFTSIYIIYLKDKNTGNDDNDNYLEEDDNNAIEFNFNTLTKKIEKLLDGTKIIDENYLDNPTIIKDKKRKSLASQSIISSIYTKTKFTKMNKLAINENGSTLNNNTFYNNNYMFDNEKRKKEINVSIVTKNMIPKCENRFNFELILIESIAGYKYNIKQKVIEIPVKNMEDKCEDDDYSNTKSENNSTKKDEKEEEIFEKKDLKEKEKMNESKIKFYYYEPSGIDLILLEKIFKDIEIKKNLRYYCTNSYTNEEYEPLPSSTLLAELFELQKKLENINIKQKKEYKLLYEHFIKNDMQKFIKNLLKTFNISDIENIDLMENFSFNRYNEIYPYHSSYNINESKKILSLVETLKKYEFELENEYFAQLTKSDKKPPDTSIINLYKSDIVQFLNSLIYLYPYYDKNICLIFFKAGFKLLFVNCMNADINIISKTTIKEDRTVNDKHSELNINAIFNSIILLFSRNINHSILKSNKLFFIVLVSIDIFLRKIKDNHIFLSQNKKLIKEFFQKLDFILNHLKDDFETISNFMISTRSQQKSNKYLKIEQSLNYLINFVKTLIDFKKIDKDILTEKIYNFIEDIVERIIRLINLLLEQNKKTSFETIELLLNFVYYFVEGPDIENFKTLFNKGYYNLISHCINKIDYYNLFLGNINKENLNEILDNKVEQEYRIIKILFTFYCLCHYEYKDTNEFIKMRSWFEENFKNIKKKLKTIYYLSKTEMENKDYDLDKMFLFLKVDDSYSEEELRTRFGIPKSEKENKKKEENSKKKIKLSSNLAEGNQRSEIIDDLDETHIKIKRNNEFKDYCLIKFELILIYYSLFNYYQDSFNDEFLNLPPKQNIVKKIFDFLVVCFNYIKYILLCPFYLVYFIYFICTKKVKTKIELLQELSDIELKSQGLDEKEMFKFLKSKIKYIEISLDYRLFKVYYPLLNKSSHIQDNKENYMKVDNNQLSNYVNYILNNYDQINLVASQYCKIHKFFDLPVMTAIFNNDNLYSLFLLIIGAIINILLGLSYSIFTGESCRNEYDNDNESIRRYCPHFLYKEESDYENISNIFRYLGYIMLVLQLILFTKYLIVTLAETIAFYKNAYYKEILRGDKDDTTLSYLIGFIPSFLKIFTNIKMIYYLFSLFFIILGILLHPFFYCFVLLELVKRAEILQILLSALYVPIINIVKTLLLCIILEYLFAIVALTNYKSHFRINDTKTMLKSFLKLFDQTFKQDGGVGAYLDVKNEPGYIPFVAKYYIGTRFVFDLIFFLLINMIAFQLFFNIVIDYFSQTREQTEEFTELSEIKCLICGLEREDLDKIYSNSKNAFELHINHAHNLIDYISYLVYLQKLSFKDPIIEERIWKLHLSNNISYLPKEVCFKQKEKEMLQEYLKNK